MAEASVAVVIVTYKSADLTIDCLRSVAAERQRCPELAIRCIVVDNASGDAPSIGRAVAAEAWSGWVTVHAAERNGGFAYGNNIGARIAYDAGPPDFLHLLNPDTVLRPGAIAALVRFLRHHAGVGIAGGIFENADASEWAVAFRFPTVVGQMLDGLHFGPVTRALARWETVMHLGAEAVPVDWVSGASMMVRREVFDTVGGLDEGFFLYFEETEFCFRAKAAGFEVWYVPESRVLHIAGQSTKVTERNVRPRRLPAYWFQSRNRYFARTGGTAQALAADVAAVVAGAVGGLKRRLQGRADHGIPHFLRDVVANSLFWPRNRRGGFRDATIPRFL